MKKCYIESLNIENPIV